MTAVDTGPAQTEPEAPPPSAPRGLGGYQPGLDGMRAVGMAIMLAFHAEFAWARGAFLALSQFFTMSGFLVTTVLLHSVERHGRLDLKRFWTRRVRRLMPASLVALAGIVVFGATVATRQQADVLPRQIAAAAANAANWLFVFNKTSYVDQFSAPSPVQHFWSLSVEEQFYVIVPVSLLIILRFTRSRFVLGCVVGAGAVLSAAWMAVLNSGGASLDRLYYGTDTRLAEMLTGALLAIILSGTGIGLPQRWRAVAGWVGAAVYGVSLWGFTALPLADGPMWWGGTLVFSTMTCIAILGILTGTGPLRLLAWRPLAAMGRITYGLYLYHLPIFLWLTASRTGLDQWPLFGLRLTVTFAAAIASYHLIELPIRNGATLITRDRLRMALGPIIAVIIVATGFATIGRSAGDPLATLRSGGSGSSAPPKSVADPTLDVLVITDQAGEAVADRLARSATDDAALTVTLAPVFSCERVVGSPGSRTCSNWLSTWPKLIEQAKPDAVLFYVDGWPEADLRRLAGPGPADLRGLAKELLATGFDLLSVKQAPIVWTSTGTNIPIGIQRATQPFQLAMLELLNSRPDVRVTQSLPYTADVGDSGYVASATKILRTELTLLRRRPEASVPRVMVVGDSQARSLGYGLERYEADTGGAVVWNVAIPGCGIATAGTIIDLVSDAQAQPDAACEKSVGAWAGNVAKFHPDVVIVLSSLRDVQDRRLDGWNDFRVIGQPAMDQYLLDTYLDAVDTLSGEGATVVWMEAPCVRYKSPFGGSAQRPRAFEPERIVHLNDVILADLAKARPRNVRLFALDDLLCPGGAYQDGLGDLRNARPDGIHPSVEAAIYLAGILDREIVQKYGG